jgi:organic radical activating enzyme
MSQCGVAVNGFVVTAPMQPAAMTGEPIISIDDFKTRYRRGSTGLVLTVDSDYYDELLPKLLFAFDDIFFLKERYKRFAYNRKSHWANGKFEFTFTIVDHCNLACYSCSTASPLANERFYDYRQFEAELLQMKKLFGDGLSTLWISGGEPLLHPRLLDFLRLAREVLQAGGQMGRQTDIKLITNGILLNKLGDDYYKCFADADITICWTRYPVKYPDLENVFKRFRQFGVKYTYSEDTIDSPKQSAWMGLAGQATQKRWDYLFCQMHNTCLVCKDGKIYHCPVRMAADNIHAGFDVATPVRDGDELDIFSAKNADEILAYLSKRPALCDYCPLRDRRIVGDWRPSKKERGEWLLEASGVILFSD